MALTSTIYPFDIELADTDRGVYESVSVRLACHPSETPEALVCRALAYCLEYTEGIGFSAGLSDGTEPAIWVKDLTGALRCWIDIGSPDAARLHRASKLAPRVVVYTHKDPATLVRQLAGERIHRMEDLEVYAIDRALIDAVVSRLERRMRFDLTVTERHLYLSLGGDTFSGEVLRIFLKP